MSIEAPPAVTPPATYSFGHLELAWLHNLRKALAGVGCGQGDAVYAALVVEIVKRERAVARSRRRARTDKEP